MNKLHFNGLKQIDTPERWMQKALSVPARDAVRPYRVSPHKSAMIAASFVLVAALSISAFFFFGNKSAVPIASVSESTTFSETVKETESKSETEPEASSDAPASENTDTPTEVETQVSADAQGNTVITTITTITTGTGDVPADQAETSDPALNTDPDNGNGQETQPAAHSDADQPLSAGASGDHENVLLVKYNEPPIKDYGSISDSSSSDIGYCLIYDKAGNLLGDSNPYARIHWAEIVTLDDGVRCIFYYPEKRGLYLSDGVYRCTFLTEDRDEVFSREFEVYESKFIFHG